jgi:hypothetical protein
VLGELTKKVTPGMVHLMKNVGKNGSFPIIGKMLTT